MEDFSSFEDRFCQRCKHLRENFEGFVSFNIVDQCPSTLKEKIAWKDDCLRKETVYYNDKLDVENRKNKLDKSAANCKLSKRGWWISCEIANYFSDFHYGNVLFNEEFV